jgi:hypothetical protein
MWARAFAHRHDVVDLGLGLPGKAEVGQVAFGASFSALPSTRSTSGMAAKRSGSIWAAQPVTTMRAEGLSLRARRIAWRAWRVASAVTAQVFRMIASPAPAAAAWARMTSDS